MIRNIITWNMQGATTSGDNVYVSTIDPYMQSGAGALVMFLQECGEPPRSAELRGERFGVRVYKYKDFYICHDQWDVLGNRVNQAILLPERPNDNNIRRFQGIAGLRPSLGVQFQGTWFLTIHAASKSGGDVRRLLRNIKTGLGQVMPQGAEYRVFVGGDFNREPATLTANEIPAGFAVCPPNIVTRPASQKKLDYLVSNLRAPIIGHVNDQIYESDHYPVVYSI